MALIFVVTALFAVLFLGSEGRRSVWREPCKVRTQIFNATGHLINKRYQYYNSVCVNDFECPDGWDHPTKSITFHDESLGSIRTDKTLVFCESPYCGWFPLCKERHWATILYIKKEESSRLRIFCRCSDGFKSVQYLGEDWLDHSGHNSHRLYMCDNKPECRPDGHCLIDTFEAPELNGTRRVTKICNCSQGQKCNRLETSGREKKYYCRNA